MATKNEPIEINIRRVCIEKKKKLICRSVPHSLNQTLRMHWGQKHTWNKAWAEQVTWLIREKQRVVKPLKYARIEIELRSLKPQDKDNAYGSVKALVDAMKGFIIEDDNPDQLDLIVTSTKVGHLHDEGVKIRITELAKNGR